MYLYLGKKGCEITWVKGERILYNRTILISNIELTFKEYLRETLQRVVNTINVSKNNLNDYEKKKLESLQRIQSFILASHTGARTQALRMKRKGLQLPDMKPTDDQSTDWED